MQLPFAMIDVSESVGLRSETTCGYVCRLNARNCESTRKCKERAGTYSPSTGIASYPLLMRYPSKESQRGTWEMLELD